MAKDKQEQIMDLETFNKLGEDPEALKSLVLSLEQSQNNLKNARKKSATRKEEYLTWDEAERIRQARIEEKYGTLGKTTQLPKKLKQAANAGKLNSRIGGTGSRFSASLKNVNPKNRESSKTELQKLKEEFGLTTKVIKEAKQVQSKSGLEELKFNPETDEAIEVEPDKFERNFLISTKGFLNKDELGKLLISSWDEYQNIKDEPRDKNDEDEGFDPEMGSFLDWFLSGKFAKKLLNLCKRGFKAVGRAVVGILRGLFRTLKNIILHPIRSFKTLLRTFKAIAKKIVQFAKTTVRTVKNAPKLLKNAWRGMKKLPQMVKSGFKSLRGLKSVKNLIKVTKNGLKGIVRMVKGAGKAGTSILEPAIALVEGGVVTYQQLKEGKGDTIGDALVDDLKEDVTNNLEDLFGSDKSLLERAMGGLGLFGDLFKGALAGGGWVGQKISQGVFWAWDNTFGKWFGDSPEEQHEKAIRSVAEMKYKSNPKYTVDQYVKIYKRAEQAKAAKDFDTTRALFGVFNGEDNGYVVGFDKKGNINNIIRPTVEVYFPSGWDPSLEEPTTLKDDDIRTLPEEQSKPQASNNVQTMKQFKGDTDIQTGRMVSVGVA